MTKNILLGGLLAVLAIGLMTVPAYAESEPVASPLEQLKMGIPVGQIQCSQDKIW